MPRKGDIKFIPSTSKADPAVFPLAMIPNEIKRDAEEVYQAITMAGAGRMHVEYDTADEVREFRRQIEAYCTHRPTDVAQIKALFITVAEDGTVTELVEGGAAIAEKVTKGGPLRFRQSPSKNLPKDGTQIDFRITDIPAVDPATQKIQDATAKAAEDAAAKVTEDGEEPSGASTADPATVEPEKTAPVMASAATPTKTGTSRKR